jgi:soluble lytic murein transglycosylase
MPYLILLIFSVIALHGVTLKEINAYPKSIAKDFYIWQYLDQDISAKEANKAYKQVRRKSNPKILYRYAKKTDDKKIKYSVKCKKLKGKSLATTKDPYCINLGLNQFKATKLTKVERKRLANRLAKKHPGKARWLYSMASSNPFQSATKKGVNTYLNLFMHSGSAYRAKYLNKVIPKPFLNRLAKSNRFEKFVIKVMTSKGLTNIKKSLLLLKPSKRYTSKTSFYLALNGLKYNYKTRAKKFLVYAKRRAHLRSHKDNIIFWQYLLTKKKSFLQELNESHDVNIYTIFAKEKLNKYFNNVIKHVPTYKRDEHLDPTDPFDRHSFYIELKKTPKTKLITKAKKYQTKNQLPFYALMKQNGLSHKKQFFIMPFNHYMHKYPIPRKALMNAIARQESRFIPGSISHAFALGTMQIMPFLIKAIAKERKESVTLEEMFEPEKNIIYANHHLNYLEPRLHHPLLISYAYNGGIGFVRRILTKNRLFQAGKYEPFMSMELIPYHETRKYGKHVLANYVIYRDLLGEPIKISQLFDSLAKSSQTVRLKK